MSEPAAVAASPKSRLLRSSLIVSTMTMFSRVLGLARDVVFAWFIGASGGADAFFVAFKIPNFLRRLFAEGAFSQAFVPVLSDYRQNRSLFEVQHLVNYVAGTLGFAVLALSALAVMGAPLLAFLFAPGFYFQGPEKFALTADLIRITFPYLALISLAGFVGAILNSYDRFAVPAFTPVLLNVVLISSAVFASSWFTSPSMALAWGVLIAGLLQLAFQLPFLVPLGLVPRPRVSWKDPAIKRVLTLMIPALFGVSVAQLNLLLDTVLASLITDGSVSWLYYSDRLIELPLGVFGIAIATVILPSLSRQHASDDEHYSATLDWALRSVLFIAIPASCALMALGQPIITTLFLHGDRFSLNDVAMASYSLMAYASGLPAFMLIKVLATGYFSRQDTRTPVKIGVKAMLSNMVLNIVFVTPLYLVWQVGHVGLALATAISAYMNAFWLWRGLRTQGMYVPLPGWPSYLVKLCFASVFMASALVLGLMIPPPFADLDWLWRIVYLLPFCVVGLALFLVGMLVAGWRPRHLKPQAI